MKTSVALLFVIFAVASAVRITNCGGSANVDLSKIQITGCARRTRCFFKKGQDASMSLPFTPSVQVTAVKAVVTGIILFVPVPFALPNDNGCVNSGMQCPLAPNTLQTYNASLPVSSSYPSINVKVKWELKDQNNNDLVCIVFPVKLVS